MLFFRYCFCLVIFLCVYSVSFAAALQNGLCEQETDALNCLKMNFVTLYSNNYNRFWEILHDATAMAEKCDSIENTKNFMDLVRIESNNAEFNEYFNKVVERLSITKTDCFLAVLTSMDMHLKIMIIEKLRHPLFIDRVDIEKAVNSYKNNEEYKTVIDLYFGKR